MNFQAEAVVYIVICVVNILVSGYFCVISEKRATRGFMACYMAMSVYGIGLAIRVLGGGA